MIDYSIYKHGSRRDGKRKLFICDTRSRHITVDGDVRDADKQQQKEVNVSFIHNEVIINLMSEEKLSKKQAKYTSEDLKRLQSYRFNIEYNKYLKEFMIANPPKFKISNKCCEYAKKKVAHQFIEKSDCDLDIIGVRKSEGGVRASAYKNCFSDNNTKTSQYRPLFWFTDSDKTTYENIFDIKHSDCYEVYGLKRTGCVGCPYGRKLNEELSVVEHYEPKLLKAINNIFKDSYEYTRQYHQFVEEQKKLS